MFLFFTQLLLNMVSTTWIVPTHKSPAPLIGLLASLPLFMLLPWLLKRNIRAFVGLCFLQLAYFIPATFHIFMFKQYGWMPFVETTNIIVLFVLAMMFARWEQKRLGISVTR